MKRKLTIFIIFLILIYLLSCPQHAYFYAKDGILLWYSKILPTLLPFTILMNIILPLGILNPLCNGLEKKLKRILPISVYGWYVFFCGYLFGFPMGAKVTADLVQQKKLSIAEGNILGSSCNQFGPMFISSYIMTQSLHCSFYMIPGFVILYGSSLVVMIAQFLILHNPSTPQKRNPIRPVSKQSLTFQILDGAIMNGFELMLKLCGYIVIFSLLSGMISALPDFGTYVGEAATGLLEVTNGIHAITSTNLAFSEKFIFCLGITSFGGLSGLAQTASFYKESGLSICYYCCVKIANGVLTVLFSIFFLSLVS
ncbi:MAG: hypothetical protein RR223_03165 [Lachnospiraceae bacterium]